jgi:hypothetical protein
MAVYKQQLTNGYSRAANLTGLLDRIITNPANGTDKSELVVTATLTGTSVTGITIGTAGKGYIYPPQIVVGTEWAASTALTGGGIRFTGTNAQISANAAALRVTADTGVIVAGPNSRILDVNVSNSATGGNGTCNGGTQSTITLRPLLLDQSFKKGIIQLKN